MTRKEIRNSAMDITAQQLDSLDEGGKFFQLDACGEELFEHLEAAIEGGQRKKALELLGMIRKLDSAEDVCMACRDRLSKKSIKESHAITAATEKPHEGFKYPDEAA